MGFAGFGLVCY